MSQKTFPRVTKIFKYVCIYSTYKAGCELISCRFFWKCIFKITCSGKVRTPSQCIDKYLQVYSNGFGRFQGLSDHERFAMTMPTDE